MNRRFWHSSNSYNYQSAVGEKAVVHYHKCLRSEIETAVSNKQMLLHGPDTLEHFTTFSMDAVIEELKSTCPHVYGLLQQLGDTERNATEGILPGVVALCTILNARSAQVKGVQLLITLTAKATSRQVRLEWISLRHT